MLFHAATRSVPSYLHYCFTADRKNISLVNFLDRLSTALLLYVPQKLNSCQSKIFGSVLWDNMKTKCFVMVSCELEGLVEILPKKIYKINQLEIRTLLVIFYILKRQVDRILLFTLMCTSFERNMYGPTGSNLN